MDEKGEPLSKEDLATYNVYRKMIGEYRVKKLRTEYEGKGYKVTTFAVEAQGLDMIAENESEVLGIECTNWNKKGYLNADRRGEMIANWNQKEQELKRNGDKRKYRRILVYSYPENIEGSVSFLHEANVELNELKRQDIPPELVIDEETKRWRFRGWIDIISEF